MTEIDTMNYDFSGVSTEELKAMEAAIVKERNSRREVRYNELVNALCNAFNEFRREFPTTCLDVDIECDQCDYSTSLDLIEYFRNGLKPSDFSR